MVSSARKAQVHRPTFRLDAARLATRGRGIERIGIGSGSLETSVLVAAGKPTNLLAGGAVMDAQPTGLSSSGDSSGPYSQSTTDASPHRDSRKVKLRQAVTALDPGVAIFRRSGRNWGYRAGPGHAHDKLRFVDGWSAALCLSCEPAQVPQDWVVSYSPRILRVHARGLTKFSVLAGEWFGEAYGKRRPGGSGRNLCVEGDRSTRRTRRKYTDGRWRSDSANTRAAGTIPCAMAADLLSLGLRFCGSYLPQHQPSDSRVGRAHGPWPVRTARSTGYRYPEIEDLARREVIAAGLQRGTSASEAAIVQRMILARAVHGLRIRRAHRYRLHLMKISRARVPDASATLSNVRLAIFPGL